MADDIALRNPDALTDAPLEEQTGRGEDEAKVGELLELEKAKAAKRAFDLFFGQKEIMARRIAQWKVNALRRMGVPNVSLQKDPDKREWVAHIPAGTTPDSVPAVNKAATLCRRFVALIFADPPAPDPMPSTGEEEDIEAAETSERVLLDFDSESGINYGTGRKALDRAATYASAFVRYYVDPKGGGQVPIEIEASPEAQTVDDAIDHPVMQPEVIEHPEFPGEMVPNPEAGQPVMDPETGEPLREDWPPPYINRYVREDGALTDDPREAEKRWAPKVKREVLTGKNVRFLPHTAEDVWEAYGIQIGVFKAWGDLKRLYPKLAELEKADEGKEQIKKLTKFQGEGGVDDLMDAAERRAAEDAKTLDEEMVLTIVTYIEGPHPDYPKGAYMVSLADSYVVERGELVEEVDGEEELLTIPVTQYKMFDEGRADPYGVALMELIGPGNEIRTAVFGSLLDHLERFGKRKTFLPMHSNLRPQDLRGPTGTVLPIIAGGEPKYEDVPDFPQDGLRTWEIVSTEMDNASTLEEQAQGVNSPSVESGRHAYAIISQVQAAMSEITQNTQRGTVRGWQIILQLVRAYYTTPQVLKYSGEDGRFRVDSWMGADLRSTRDVRIKPGTMTMLAPAAKAQLAERFLELQAIDQSEYREIASSQTGPLLGIKDNPFRLRIKQQLSDWKKGPPEDWRPPKPTVIAVDPMGQQVDPVQAQLAGVPVQEQQVPTPDPEAAAIFEPVPADMLPNVAMIRIEELAKAMSQQDYLAHPIEWRLPLEQEFQRLLMTMQPAQPAEESENGGPPSRSEPADPGTAERPFEQPAPEGPA